LNPDALVQVAYGGREEGFQALTWRHRPQGLRI